MNRANHWRISLKSGHAFLHCQYYVGTLCETCSTPQITITTALSGKLIVTKSSVEATTFAINESRQWIGPKQLDGRLGNCELLAFVSKCLVKLIPIFLHRQRMIRAIWVMPHRSGVLRSPRWNPTSLVRTSSHLFPNLARSILATIRHRGRPEKRIYYSSMYIRTDV